MQSHARFMSVAFSIVWSRTSARSNRSGVVSTRLFRDRCGRVRSNPSSRGELRAFLPAASRASLRSLCRQRNVAVAARL
jgi:hypothetical protein